MRDSASKLVCCHVVEKYLGGYSGHIGENTGCHSVTSSKLSVIPVTLEKKLKSFRLPKSPKVNKKTSKTNHLRNVSRKLSCVLFCHLPKDLKKSLETPTKVYLVLLIPFLSTGTCTLQGRRETTFTFSCSNNISPLQHQIKIAKSSNSQLFPTEHLKINLPL